MATTLVGEALNQGDEGMRAVAWVIKNRMVDPRWPDDCEKVCLQKYQFSCWNLSPWNLKNLHRMLMHTTKQTKEWRRAREIGEKVMTLESVDPTKGANHYHTISLLGTKKQPSWAEASKVTVQLNDHIFYKL